MRRTKAAAKALAAAVALMAAGHGAAQAQTWFDPQFFAIGTSVTVRYLGGDAAFFDTMQWFQIPFSAIPFIDVPGANIVDYNALGGVTGGNYVNLFSNKKHLDAPVTAYNNASTVIVNTGAASPIGSTANLSTVSGAEVLLALFVNNENKNGAVTMPLEWKSQDANDYTYFSGPGRNQDGTYHIRVEQTGVGQYAVFSGGWEDIKNGGDFDYNDMLFSIEGVTVTPEPVSMTLIGTGLFGVAAAARRRRMAAAAAA
jgi:hypothetical protein